MNKIDGGNEKDRFYTKVYTCYTNIDDKNVNIPTD